MVSLCHLSAWAQKPQSKPRRQVQRVLLVLHWRTNSQEMLGRCDPVRNQTEDNSTTYVKIIGPVPRWR